MKFQLLGNETLVDHIIRCNLCGAAQPEMLTDFCERWERYTQTDLYLRARRESEKHEPGHVRRAKKLWHLKQKLKRAHWIADWIAEKSANWYKLTRSDKNLWYSMEDLLAELQAVQRTPASERYAGTGSGTANVWRLAEPVLHNLASGRANVAQPAVWHIQSGNPGV